MQEAKNMPKKLMSVYMKDIKNVDLLTKEEEIMLAETMKNGTQEEAQAARDRLISANLRLVVKLAHEFKHGTVPFEDLVAEGNIGLITAVDKFDPSKGSKFSCYAAWWIKQAMRKALMWQARTIRIPGVSAHNIRLLTRARAAYMTEHSREPTIDELVEITGLSEKTIRTLDASATDTVYMEEQLNADTDTTFESMLTTADDTDYRREICCDKVHTALATLSDMGRRIIEWLFGIGGAKQLRMEVVAQRVGCTVTRLKEIVDDLLRKLKTALSDSSIETSAQTAQA